MVQYHFVTDCIYKTTYISYTNLGCFSSVKNSVSHIGQTSQCWFKLRIIHEKHDCIGCDIVLCSGLYNVRMTYKPSHVHAHLFLEFSHSHRKFSYREARLIMGFWKELCNLLSFLFIYLFLIFCFCYNIYCLERFF